MKSYYRIMLGRQSIHAKEAHTGNFVGAGWFETTDLTNKFPENWRDFNKEMIPLYQKENPDSSKVTAGLACGMLWTISKGILIGDIVLSPDGQGNYYVGEVAGDYEYNKGRLLPHRRKVLWFQRSISRDEMSESLKNSAGSIGTVSNISQYNEEIEKLIAGERPPSIVSTDESIEDPSNFALEMHLEDFLVQNWHHTELGKKYNIYEDNGQIIGQQYMSDTGPIDILAISKDKKEILVVELKKGRASDLVVGQILRYMGYVKAELAEKNQSVRGLIIAQENDIRLQRALSVTQNIEFYKYKVHFNLIKE